ncbi:hypothetical protein Hanom_Chr17g01585551 [Helianthus anomalus]
MPEHPPCLTPILKHKSSFFSDLILFKCFKAVSVNAMAGAIPPDATIHTYIQVVLLPNKRTIKICN